MSDLLLALDTSGALVTVAVAEGGADGDGRVAVRAERDVEQVNRHAELLAPMISEALAEAGAAASALTAVAVGVGPGPFTGLRVGLVTAQTLGHTLGVPVLGVCSLDALADRVVAHHGGSGPAEFVVATDARRREVYWARYRVVAAAGGTGTAERIDGPAVRAPADLAAALGGVPVVGRGAALYPDLLGEPPAGSPLDVTAAAVARLAVRMRRRGDPLAVRPLYLRRPDAAVPGARKRVQ